MTDTNCMRLGPTDWYKKKRLGGVDSWEKTNTFRSLAFEVEYQEAGINGISG